MPARGATISPQQEAAGATEIAYQPAGPDIEGELRRFMDMANG